MKKKRELKSAMADPLVKKKSTNKKFVAQTSADQPSSNLAGKIGFAAIAAAVTLGFVGGWMARRWLRLI